MNGNVFDNEHPPKILKPSEDVIKEIVSNPEGSDASVLGRAGTDETDFVLRLQRLERQAGLVVATDDLQSERDEDEKRQLQLVKQQELRKLVAEADKMVQDNEGRRAFSRNIFTVTVIWLVFVMSVVVQSARKEWHLSDAVLIALITTTTATVVGIFLIVANYLFNREKST